MKSIRVLLISILIFNIYSSYSQPKPVLKRDMDSTIVEKNSDGSIILDKRKTLQTDIFILNTCAPDQLSIIKMYDDYRQVKIIPARRLSISVNRFSTFKITNINPHRFVYSINNTLVTQFTENDPFNAYNNTFKDGTALPINEIEIIELFKAGKNSDSKRKKIDDIKKEINSISLDFQNAENQIKDLTKERDESPDVGKKREIQKQINDISTNKYKVAFSKYNNAISDYSSMVSSLTVNGEYLLGNFKSIEMNDTVPDDTKVVVNNISKLAEDLIKKTKEMDSIKSQIKKLSAYNQSSFEAYNFSKKRVDNFYDQKIDENFDPVNYLSNKYGYIVNNANINSDDPSVRLLEITKMDEFISDKKISEWELFVLSTSKEIGKLLQNKIIEASETKNHIVQQNCITEDFIHDIDKYEGTIRSTFTIIRNFGAELNVLINYLELDNILFGNVINGVNNNYTKLKDYLTFFEYTSLNNTVEFTLPSHTNLKNVDLIRYHIDREDKITHSSQSYVYDIWLKGGLKIDFSAGIFATSLIDYDYEKTQAYSKTNPATLLVDTILVNRKDNGKFDFAFGGMVNITLRTGASWIAPGISLGTAYAKNQKLQFLGAFSLHLGKTERLILHGGFAAGLNKTLDLANLNYDKTIDNEGGRHYLVKGKYEDFNFQTIEKFSFKPFFGISYNLSKKNALQAASNANDYSPNSTAGTTSPSVVTK